MRRKKHRLRGFTLIELMAVIVIIGMLMALLIPAVQQLANRAAGLSAPTTAIRSNGPCWDSPPPKITFPT